MSGIRSNGANVYGGYYSNTAFYKKTAKERVQKTPYEKEEKETVKRTTIEAGSYDELLDKLQTFDWSKVADSKSGDRFDFSV